jgi:recombination protein RecR
MNVLPKSVQKVIDEFAKLPGIGPKTSARMVYHYLRSMRADSREVVNLAKSLLEMHKEVVLCDKCFNISDQKICSVCANNLRDKNLLCVVEETLDIVAFEDAGVFNGFYFVLGGVISPAEGIGAEELRFSELEKRVKDLIEESDDGAIELIVATNPSLEGEATASYIQDMLKELINEGKVEITRLAMGLPTGADLEYADRLTLKRALEGRNKFE